MYALPFKKFTEVCTTTYVQSFVKYQMKYVKSLEDIKFAYFQKIDIKQVNKHQYATLREEASGESTNYFPSTILYVINAMCLSPTIASGNAIFEMRRIAVNT